MKIPQGEITKEQTREIMKDIGNVKSFTVFKNMILIQFNDGRTLEIEADNKGEFRFYNI